MAQNGQKFSKIRVFLEYLKFSLFDFSQTLKKVASYQCLKGFSSLYPMHKSNFALFGPTKRGKMAKIVKIQSFFVCLKFYIFDFSETFQKVEPLNI